MSDTLYGGRRFRTLNILDEGVREGLAIEVDTWIPVERVSRALEQVVSWRGQPQPDQHAFIERYDRTNWIEVLNAYVIESFEQVREISAEWLQSYNEERHHDAFAGVPPAVYRAQLEARHCPFEVSP